MAVSSSNGRLGGDRNLTRRATVIISETLTFDCVRFPEARAIKRKIIYHAGPTNSGKTHSALERFHASDSGVYCGPLRLLATEVFRRTNEAVS